MTAALTSARELKDEFWLAWVKLRLGVMWGMRGEIEKGLFFIIDAFETAEQAGNPRFLAAVLYEWGSALLNREAWANAEAKFQKADDLWRESGQTEKATQSLAGLAYVTYRQELPETAAAHAEQLWATWQESPVMAERADLKLYWMLGMVWDGLGDSRANELWSKANTLLQQRCEQIPDERARKLFLEQVPAHRAILNGPM